MPESRLTKHDIASLPFTITDGAWGTELLHRGARLGDCFELLNLTAPDVVRALAAEYVAAGSEVVLTNSFGAGRLALASIGRSQDARAINEAAARLSRDAAGDDAFVFGVIGPCRRDVSAGDVVANRLYDSVAEQATALVAGGADALILETMLDLAEVEFTLEVLEREVTVPYGACMTFDVNDAAVFTKRGIRPEAFARVVEASGAAFFGANCSSSVAAALDTARALARASRLPLWLKPSAGLPTVRAGVLDYPVAPAEFAAPLREYFASGVRLLGGCCGTTPAFVRALKAEATADDGW